MTSGFMISAVILTRNEEKNITTCIRSLSWCDEIIVIDDNSQDNTLAIAKRLGAKIFVNPLEGDFSKQRNFGILQAKGEWVLFIDADEKISESLAYEITHVIHDIQSEQYVCFSVQRIDNMWGKELKYGEAGNARIIRLVRNGSGKWKGTVHEKWKTKGKVGMLKNPLFHFPHQSIDEFLGEINFYTTLRAKALYDKKVKVYWWEIFAYPKAKFFVNYFLKKGVFDGIPGLVVALIMSFHSFLVRGKLWLLWQKK